MTATGYGYLVKAGNDWRRAKATERERMADLYTAIRAAVDAGVSEVEAGKIAGVDRGTVRRALGKPRA